MLSQPPEVNLLARHLSPDIQHPAFGTDNLGRDVWLRCLWGLHQFTICWRRAKSSGVIALVMAAVARIHPLLGPPDAADNRCLCLPCRIYFC